MTVRRAAVARRRKLLLVGIGTLLLGAGFAIAAAISAKHGQPNNLPATKRVISIGGEPRSLTLDGGRILIAGAEGRITELRSATAKRSQRMVVNRPLREITAFGGRVFVVSDDGVLTAFDRALPGRRAVRGITPGPVVLSVAVNSHGVFVASRSSGWIEQRTPRALRLLSRVRLPGRISDLVATPDGIWAALRDRDAVAFIPYWRGGSHGKHVLVSGYPRPVALAAGEGKVWVASDAPRVLWAIDEQTRTLSSAIKPAVIPLPSSIHVANGSVWVASADRDRLVQVGAGTGGLTDRFPVGTGRQPRDLVVDVSAVWTANYGDGTVTRVDLDRLGAAHRLPAPADEPPRFAGVSRSVWALTVVAFMCLAVLFGLLRWVEGLLLATMAGRVPAHVRPLYADPRELGHLAGRQPIKEVVTEEQQRARKARLGRNTGAGVEDSGMRRNEKVFDTHQASEVARSVINDLAHRGKLYRDFGLVPLDDMGLRRRGADIDEKSLTAAMRARHDRLPDVAVLIERRTWTLKRLDGKNARMTLSSVGSRDGAHTYALAPEAHLTLRLDARHFLEGRGQELLRAQGNISCDVLAVVERRGDNEALELTAVALYTPVSDQVHLGGGHERLQRLRPRRRRTRSQH